MRVYSFYVVLSNALSNVFNEGIEVLLPAKMCSHMFLQHNQNICRNWQKRLPK